MGIVEFMENYKLPEGPMPEPLPWIRLGHEWLNEMLDLSQKERSARIELGRRRAMKASLQKDLIAWYKATGQEYVVINPKDT